MMNVSDRSDLGPSSLDLITKAELAKRFGFCERTITRMVERGRLPAPVQIGSQVRWRVVDIEQWLDQQRKGVKA